MGSRTDTAGLRNTACGIVRAGTKVVIFSELSLNRTQFQMAMSLLVVVRRQEELFYVEKQLRVYDVIRYPSGTR